MTDVVLGAVLALMFMKALTNHEDKRIEKTEDTLLPVEPIFLPSANSIPRVPKNIERGNFSQVGTLKGVVDGRSVVLPLYSKPSGTNRDRYHYYTLTETNQQPASIVQENRDCMNDPIGCKEIFEGDAVHVDAFDSTSFSPYMFQ